MTPGRPVRLPTGAAAALLVAAGLLVLDALEGPRVQFVGLLATVPFIAATLAGPGATLATGLTALTTGFGFGFLQQAETGGTAGLSPPQLIRLALIAAATVGATLAGSVRVRREQRLVELGSMAEAAQTVITRPLPEEVGPVRCAMCYRCAAPEERVGGDLIELADTPFGVRWVVGDVPGHSLDAVRLAGQVMGAFREYALRAADLDELAAGMDLLPGSASVSAVLGEVRRDGRLELVCIGRPAPVLLRADGSALTPQPRPDGGGLAAPEAGQGRLDWRLEIGDRLVMVTEGGLDAHRAGGPFEALPAVHRCMSGRDLATGLDALMAELTAFAGDHADHDAAILELEFVGAGADRNGRQRSVTYPVRP